MGEIWKDIPGYEGYYKISNLGNVRSVDRTIVKPNNVAQRRKGRLLPKIETRDGYFDIRLCRDGKRFCFRLHRIVAMVFLPAPEVDIGLLEVHHKDGDRKNNCVDNLEWVTHTENIRHSVSDGTHVTCKDMSGVNNPNYGNKKLSSYYRENPNAAKKNQSRALGVNGRATPVRVCFLSNGTFIDFDCIKSCAQFLIRNNLVSSKSVGNLCCMISNFCNSKNIYCELSFELI